MPHACRSCVLWLVQQKNGRQSTPRSDTLRGVYLCCNIAPLSCEVRCRSQGVGLRGFRILNSQQLFVVSPCGVSSPACARTRVEGNDCIASVSVSECR